MKEGIRRDEERRRRKKERAILGLSSPTLNDDAGINNDKIAEVEPLPLGLNVTTNATEDDDIVPGSTRWQKLQALHKELSLIEPYFTETK